MDAKEKKCRWYVLSGVQIEELPVKPDRQGVIESLPRRSGRQSIILGVWYLSRQDVPVFLCDFHRLYICIEATGQWRVKTMP
ncbi:hypothetical protein, partial [Desulfotomaculum copahuensis]|uniref:hypothetical protein n=1 Tax=Desulfotomaculum copahuensis TaxID=1838280 RepID=UPI000A4B7987